VAISIWVYVMNLNRSVAEKTITLTVDVSGQIEAATDGMTIISDSNTIDGVSIDYSQLTVKVTVSGMQSVLDKYKDSDYSVKVDASDIEVAGVYALSLSCVAPSNEIEIKSITAPALNGFAFIDKLETRTITNITAVNGTNAPQNYDITCSVQDLNSLVISGPKSKIDRIERAEFVIPTLVEYISSAHVSDSIRLYDANGDEIKTQDYIKITPSSANVYVKIETERSFSIVLRNNVAEKDGYRYTVNITGELTTVELYGDTVDMDSVEIVLSLDTMDLTSIPESGELSTDMIKLPEGFELRTVLEGKTVSYTVIKELIAVVNPETDTENNTESTESTGGAASDTSEIPDIMAPATTSPSGAEDVPEDGGAE
jgi:hypothetical protein